MIIVGGGVGGQDQGDKKFSRSAIRSNNLKFGHNWLWNFNCLSENLLENIFVAIWLPNLCYGDISKK